MQRWFPMSVIRSPRGFFDDFDEFASLDRQMRSMQQDMDRMFSNFQRLQRQPSGTGAIGASPLDFRQAEDALAQNPVVTDKDGQKKMQMNFDVRAFKPEEIQVGGVKLCHIICKSLRRKIHCINYSWDQYYTYL